MAGDGTEPCGFDDEDDSSRWWAEALEPRRAEIVEMEVYWLERAVGDLIEDGGLELAEMTLRKIADEISQRRRCQ